MDVPNLEILNRVNFMASSSSLLNSKELLKDEELAINNAVLKCSITVYPRGHPETAWFYFWDILTPHPTPCGYICISECDFSGTFLTLLPPL